MDEERVKRHLLKTRHYRDARAFNHLTLIIFVSLTIGLIAGGTGYWLGVQTTLDDTVLWEQVEIGNKYRTPTSSQTSVYIHDTGVYNVDSYRFNLTENPPNGTLGHTDGNGNIKILTGRKATDISNTCKHEVLHYLELPHGFIFENQGRITVPTCTELMALLDAQPTTN